MFILEAFILLSPFLTGFKQVFSQQRPFPCYIFYVIDVHWRAFPSYFALLPFTLTGLDKYAINSHRGT